MELTCVTREVMVAEGFQPGSWAEGPPLPLLAHGEPAAMPAPLFFAPYNGPMAGLFLDDASRHDV